MKKVAYFLGIGLFLFLLTDYLTNKFTDGKKLPRIDTITIERTDTQYITKTDTLPKLVRDTLLRFIHVPATKDSDIVDSVNLQVVQRTYTDDSTYTAYVSGIGYDMYPSLDSIVVRNEYVTSIVERTIHERQKQRITIGLNVGAGLGIISRQPDIYIGIGLNYNFLR